jgi:hypothetical protein
MSKPRFHMPTCLDTRAVLDAWIGVLHAQYKSGHISRGRYRERVRQARDKWRYEVICAPERAEQPYYGRYPQGEQPERTV